MKYKMEMSRVGRSVTTPRIAGLAAQHVTYGTKFILPIGSYGGTSGAVPPRQRNSSAPPAQHSFGELWGMRPVVCRRHNLPRL